MSQANLSESAQLALVESWLDTPLTEDERRLARDMIGLKNRPPYIARYLDCQRKACRSVENPFPKTQSAEDKAKTEEAFGL